MHLNNPNPVCFEAKVAGPELAAILPVDRQMLQASDGVQQCKNRLQVFQERLIEQSRSGVSVHSLLSERAKFIDHLLIVCWQHFVRHHSGNLALIAVGGYGRRELHPYSDIDILVLLESDCSAECQADLEMWLTFLWDIGLKPGHSVRTLSECIKAAAEDQTVATSLMESRILSGDDSLFEAMKKRTGPEHIWSPEPFLEAKMDEQAGRYRKYHDTAYKLEPNVKEGPGGLRDIQMIAWVIKRYYDTPTLRELLHHDCLNKEEYDDLMAARDFLWTVRFSLHSLRGRSEERLLFEYQKAVAQQLGYQAGDDNSAVEQFMQRYYRTVMAVERLCDMLLQWFRENIFRKHSDCPIIPVAPGFQSICGYIEVTSDQAFKQRPLALLEIFLLQQQHPHLQGIRANTIRLIRQHVHLIDDDFRYTPEACSLFLEILRQPAGLAEQLRRMNRYGVLAAYLPDFAHIVGRMQFDLFHIYTVDEHTLFVVRNMHRFALDEFKHELPFCCEVFKLLLKPELLYIAGLLHDIAKGKGGDHSELGEHLAENFCRRHRMIERDTQLVRWLIRNHLIMSMTAQRKDISDPGVIHAFAEQVGSIRYLNYLYLLTVADIRATNPSLWNGWKDALLKELYIKAHLALHRGLNNPVAESDVIQSTKRKAIVQLTRMGLSHSAIHRVWTSLGRDYFLRYSAEEVSWHTVAIDALKPEQTPLVLLRRESQRGAAEVFLYTEDKPHIFSQSTAVLDQLGLTIHDARIMTCNNGFALNSYLVLGQSGDSVTDLHMEWAICERLRACIQNPRDAALTVVRRIPSQNRHFTIPDQVYFHADPQNRFSILELITMDRPGLLSRVGQVFSCLGLRVYSAKIATIGSRAEDIFSITDERNQPLVDEGFRQQLSEALLVALAKL